MCIGKTSIYNVFTIKFCGVFIDTHLNWSHFISKLIESMRSIAGPFFKIIKLYSVYLREQPVA